VEGDSVMSCEFAEVSEFLSVGRVCRLDHSACFNFDKSGLVASCPTLDAHRQGKPVGETPNLDYPGVPHVVRTGPHGDFVTGMPPNYLQGNIRVKKEGGSS
jgi:hypothetical protein